MSPLNFISLILGWFSRTHVIRRYFLFQVCDNVTELKCDIVPYTKCELKWVTKPIKAYKDTRKYYRKKGCNETEEIKLHKKLVPHCHNETKLNCVTLWKTDENGNQVIIKTI